MPLYSIKMCLCHEHFQKNIRTLFRDRYLTKQIWGSLSLNAYSQVTIFDNWNPFNNDEKYFLFCLKSSFRFIGIYVFVLIFWSFRKAAWLEKKVYFRNPWRRNLGNKQLQYAYCPISHKVKAIRQWNFVTQSNIKEKFKKGAYLWIGSIV